MRNGCILNGSVGSGKSLTSLAYYYIYVCGGSLETYTITKPRDLYIITTAMKRDKKEWPLECAQFNLVEGKNDNGVTVTIDSWNNIKKYTKVYGAFFIFDEQRVVGYGAWTKAFLNIARKNQWILLSATPGDTWSDYIPVFIANGFYRNKTEFMRRHAVITAYGGYPKISKYLETGYLCKLRNLILVPMPMKRRTVAHTVLVPCEYDKALYKTIWRDRWNPYDNEPIAEGGELCYLLRKAVNSDKSRLKSLDDIINKHQRVIIFYNFTYELEMMLEYLKQFNIDVAQWNGDKHQEVPNTKAWAYLVQYSAGAEGWNCVTTDAIIFFSQSYSYRMTIQAAGRIDRLNTPYVDLYYYKLRSSAPIDLAINHALSEKRDFNQKAFIKS